MKLNEVALDKADMIVSMIRKLLDAGVKVMMHTADTAGQPMFGMVTGISRVSPSKWSLSFYEVVDGKQRTPEDTTDTSASELEDATLKKQPDGSYILNLPNEELE